MPLNFPILMIYQLRDTYQIVGDRRSMAVIADGENARYEIEARGDPSASEAQVREMVKALLADRFQLKVHKETRDLPVSRSSRPRVASSFNQPRTTGIHACAAPSPSWTRAGSKAMLWRWRPCFKFSPAIRIGQSSARPASRSHSISVSPGLPTPEPRPMPPPTNCARPVLRRPRKSWG